MLYEFIAANRDSIISRTRERVRSRPWPSASSREIEYGVPLFLTQLAETLRLERTATPFASDLIGSTAARHPVQAARHRSPRYPSPRRPQRSRGSSARNTPT